MGQQQGVIQITGAVGNLSFYKTKDGYLVRAKGGVDGKRIKNDPRFERTRENGAEFGRAGKASKVLRKSLRTLLLNIADAGMTSRLTAEMVKVIQMDKVNPRGKRNVIDGEAELLFGFDFNANAKLNRTLFAPYTVTVTRATGNLEVRLAPFIPANLIAAPQGATHFKIVSAGAEVDFEAGKYVVVTSTSQNLVLGSQNQPTIDQLNVVTPNSTHPLFVALGIEFYQQVNGQMYSLKNGAYNALSIVGVNGGN